jgi:hypothetical protein
MNVAFALACQAPVGGVCRGSAQLTTLERLLGSKLVALNASKRARRHSKRVTVGSIMFPILAGKHAAITVPLNSTGRKLLARFKRLPATLTITLLGPPNTKVVTTTVTFKAKKKKKRKSGH